MRKAEIRELPGLIGQEVEIRGWLYNARSSGKLRFLVVRDGSGYLQAVVFKPSASEALWAEAERAMEQAKAVERDAAGKHPVLKHLAEQNAALGEALGAMAASLEGMAAEQQAAERLAKRVDEDFRNAISLKGRRGTAIIVTRGLLDDLDDDELRAVMAHEMAHLYNEDARLNTFIRQREIAAAEARETK